MHRLKLSFALFFSILIHFNAPAQKVTLNVYYQHTADKAHSDTVYYNFDRKLTWSDFQGKVPANDPWGAMTASGFSFNSQLQELDGNITVTIGVYTFFTKHNSWKKPDVNSAYHLEHEQHHFDITRLGAAELVKELKEARFTRSNYHTLINSIFSKVYAQNVAMQHQYDSETKNSMNTEVQLEWNKKISEQIAALKASIDSE